jgi:hypothetical protein
MQHVPSWFQNILTWCPFQFSQNPHASPVFFLLNQINPFNSCLYYHSCSSNS